jgi:Spy/CpxP family protein refolding chaperone
MTRSAPGWRLAPLSLVLTTALGTAAQDPAPPPAPPRQGDSQAPGPTPGGDQPAHPGRGGPPWANADWTQQAVEWLTRELDLDPGQQEKIKAILDSSVKDAYRKAAELWDPTQGPPDMEKMRGVMEDARIKIAAQINEVLSPDQRREFESIVDNFDRRAQTFEQRRRAADDPTELFDPPPISKRILLDKAERSLFLGPDETAAVMPLVEKVIDLRIALNEAHKTRRDDLRHAIEAKASDQEVRARIDAMRQAEEFQRLELVSAEQALREVLTIEQEVRMVAMGVLD